jgi:hypothetical protein
MAGGVGVRRSRGDGRELGERDGRPMGDHKSKQGFLLIGKSGKRLENCERAESEEEKMGELAGEREDAGLEGRPDEG